MDINLFQNLRAVKILTQQWLLGCFVFIIGSAICLITHSVGLLLFGRLIQGVGMGFGAALSRAILRNLCHDKKELAKLISYQSMTWLTVPLAAPIFGGYIQHFITLLFFRKRGQGTPA